MMRNTGTIIISLLLASCATGNQIAKPRSVSIQGQASPASAKLISDMQSLLDQTNPSYLTLIVHEKRRRGGRNVRNIPKALTSGSGFVIGNGYMLTAGHVAVRTGNRVDARDANGRIYAGKVVGVQKSPDIALIKLKGFSGRPVIPVSNACIKKGTAVFSLGRPHSQGDTARIGQVRSMSFGRPVSYNGFGYPDAMVLQMGTQKGESGGPVFNRNAHLAGMMVSTLSDGKGHLLNLAHALPADMLARFACSKIQCGAAWKRLAVQNSRSCRG